MHHLHQLVAIKPRRYKPEPLQSESMFLIGVGKLLTTGCGSFRNFSHLLKEYSGFYAFITVY